MASHLALSERSESKDYNILMFYVYMIRNSVEKLYVSVTKNPQARANYHNQERGARFTKYASTPFSTGLPDFKIIFLEQYETLSDARQREIQIKGWRREKKDMLIEKYRSGLETKMRS